MLYAYLHYITYIHNRVSKRYFPGWQPLCHLIHIIVIPLKKVQWVFSWRKNKRHNHDTPIFCRQFKVICDLFTQFSNDIGMVFGELKCAYEIIESGKLKSSEENLVMNGLCIRPLKEVVLKIFGSEENLSSNGPINKERVKKEYNGIVRKLWSSELSAYNKSNAQNKFILTAYNHFNSNINGTSFIIRSNTSHISNISCNDYII